MNIDQMSTREIKAKLDQIGDALETGNPFEPAGPDQKFTDLRDQLNLARTTDDIEKQRKLLRSLLDGLQAMRDAGWDVLGTGQDEDGQ